MIRKIGHHALINKPTLAFTNRETIKMDICEDFRALYISSKLERESVQRKKKGQQRKATNFRPFSYIFTSKGSFKLNSRLKGFAVSALLRHQKGESSLGKCKTHQRRNLDEMVCNARGHAPARFRDSFTGKQRD